MLKESLLERVKLTNTGEKTPINVFEIKVDADWNDADCISHTFHLDQNGFEKRLPFIKFMVDNYYGRIEDAEKYAKDNTQYKELFERCLDEFSPGGAPDPHTFHSLSIGYIKFIDKNGDYSQVELY